MIATLPGKPGKHDNKLFSKANLENLEK